MRCSPLHSPCSHCPLYLEHLLLTLCMTADSLALCQLCRMPLSHVAMVWVGSILQRSSLFKAQFLASGSNHWEVFGSWGPISSINVSIYWFTNWSKFWWIKSYWRPRAMKPAKQGQKPLKSWTRINISPSFSCFLPVFSTVIKIDPIKTKLQR